MDNLDLATVYARNCSVKKISEAEARPFIDTNHRMGYCSCRHRYGLYVQRATGSGELRLPEGTLVAVATFSNKRNMSSKGGNPGSYEWIRYASLAGVRVVGGMGKLLQAFCANIHPDDVMTYVPADGTDGSSYLALGFEYEGISEGRGYKNRKFRKKFYI